VTYISFEFLQTQKFGISILVKDLGEKGKSNFSFKRSTMMKDRCIDIGWDDLMMNYTTENNMAMNGTILWRAGREKDMCFLQILLEATTVPGEDIPHVLATYMRRKK